MFIEKEIEMKISQLLPYIVFGFSSVAIFLLFVKPYFTKIVKKLHFYGLIGYCDLDDLPTLEKYIHDDDFYLQIRSKLVDKHSLLITRMKRLLREIMIEQEEGELKEKISELVKLFNYEWENTRNDMETLNLIKALFLQPGFIVLVVKHAEIYEKYLECHKELNKFIVFSSVYKKYFKNE